jgi:uncharacterized protein (TIGR02246 family)
MMHINVLELARPWTRPLLTCLLATTLVASGANFSTAQDADRPSDDEAAVQAAVKSYVEAYNRGDATAVADHWSDDGEWLTPDGERVAGRDAIEKAMAEFFAENKGVTIEVADPRIRLVDDNVAIEEGRVIVSYPDQPPTEATYLAVHGKQDGQWRLLAVRETELPSAAADPPPLEDLAWLVGEWVDEDDASKNEISVKWSKNRTFLVSQFRVSVPDWDDLEGYQFIGWDPHEGVIRSWMFDTDGGIGAGVWTPEEDRWLVDFAQTLPDGTQATCTNIYTPVDADHYLWQSVNRVVDGEELTDLGEVEVERKPAPAAESADDEDNGQ